MTQTFVSAPRVCVLGTYAHPEGVAAGLARVSRSAEPIDHLVREASEDSALARRRNEQIVFGFGHSSVAEHACFSLAISGIPRSLSLELVSHRLASYTQLSYRYVDLPADAVHFYLPEEYAGPRQHALMLVACEHARTAYTALCSALVAYGTDQESAPTGQVLRRRATEDARYVLPCAQTTQLGMTANARTWGHVISRLRGHPLSEARALAEALYGALQPLAPSLFPEKHLGPDTYTAAVPEHVRAACAPPAQTMASGEKEGAVGLVSYDPAAEHTVAAHLLARAYGLGVGHRPSLSGRDAERVLEASFRGLRAHDRLPREFELAHYTFDVQMSECALHQLVRHRMATIIPEPRILRPAIVPPQIDAAGQRGLYEEALHVVAEAYQALRTVADPGAAGRAAFVLAGGHSRRALVGVSARELCEMSRLRCDDGAQWEIRATTEAMCSLARGVHPTIGLAFGGRKAFKHGALAICRMT